MIRFADIKIGKRLTLGFGTIAAIVVGMAAMAWWSTQSLQRAMNETSQANSMLVGGKDVGIAVQQIGSAVMGIAAAKDAKQKQEFQTAIDKARKGYKEKLDQLQAATTDEQEKKLLTDIDNAVAAIRDLNLKTVELSLAGKEDEALAGYAKSGFDGMKAVNASVQAYVAAQETQMAEVSAAAARVASRSYLSLGVCAGVGFAIAAFFGWVTTRSVNLPLKKGLDVLEIVAKGDLSKDVAPELVNRKDEIGDLGRAMQRMTLSLREVVQHLGSGSKTLASSSTELSATATQLASGAEETTQQSAQVAAAAEQMSMNMGSMAAATEQVSANIKTVATAVEELTASITEVAKSAEKAAGVASDAAQLVNTSNTQIADLGNAANEIGKVIEVIQDIAEQTNLLALNATIEAARAGEAGKGFAVVATEVKELAKQTGAATEDIRKRIEAIQGSTGNTVKSIGDIRDIIQQVNELSRTIASAVEEQSITTKEIAKNVAESSAGAQTVARGVAESATASQDITKTIVGVDLAAKQSAQGAAQTQTAGQEVSKMAEQFLQLVGQFTV